MRYRWHPQGTPVVRWPDDPDSPAEDCRDCGRLFHTVAVRGGVRSGRDRCPHCGTGRRIPDALHPLYVEWFGLVKQATRQAVAAGLTSDVAEDVAHRAYAEAILRWHPSRAAFSTIARIHIRSRIGQELKRQAKRAGVWRDADVVRPSLPVPAADTTEAADAREEAAVVTAKLLDQIPPRSADVVRMRFGIGGPRLTLAQVAERLNLSTERVRQIELRAMTVLRALAVQQSSNH